MIESQNKKELERKIDQYINGQLSDEEIEALWAELIQDDYHLDYLKTVANVKAVVESSRNQPRITYLKQYWTYAAAAVVILLVGVLTIMNYPAFQSGTDVQPISSIELDYYRSEDGVIANESNREVLKRAITLANSGDTQAAIRMLSNELEEAEAPSWIAELNMNIGSLYYNDGQYQRAASSFENVIKQEDIDVLTREKGYWYLGNAYFQMGQLDKAENAIQKAYDLNGAYRRVAKSYLDALASK